MKRLHSGIGVDVASLETSFKMFLEVEEDHLVAFMNNQFFRGEYNFIVYLTASIADEPKSGENSRRFVYEFIGDYICAYKKFLTDYLRGIFDSSYSFFKKECGYKAK